MARLASRARSVSSMNRMPYSIVSSTARNSERLSFAGDGLRERLFALLQFGHVREEADSAAILRPALVDLDPAAVVLRMQQRSTRVAMLSKSLLNPFFVAGPASRTMPRSTAVLRMSSNGVPGR